MGTLPRNNVETTFACFFENFHVSYLYDIAMLKSSKSSLLVKKGSPPPQDKEIEISLKQLR